MLKELCNVQGNVDIARGWGIIFSHILKHDLIDEDITSKPHKYLLGQELEKQFEATDLSFTKTSNLGTTLTVDFMSMIRRMLISEMSVFNDLFQATWRKVKGICEYQRIAFVFDSYIEKSVKEGERQRRSSLQTLEYVRLENDTKIPVQSDRMFK